MLRGSLFNKNKVLRKAQLPTTIEEESNFCPREVSARVRAARSGRSRARHRTRKLEKARQWPEPGSTDPQKSKIDRASEHWQFLFEHGRSGEAEAYAAALPGSDNLPPAEIFEAIGPACVAMGRP